jgi:hypothetical protein
MNRSEYFDEIMKIYPYNFLNHKEWVKSQYIKKKLNTKLVLNSKYKNNKEILESILYRYPIYYGNPTNMYNKDQVKKILNIDLDNMPDINHNIRYAITGKSIVMNNLMDIFVIHIWGINLESRYTYDFAKYISNDKLLRGIYSNSIKELIELILESALIYDTKNISKIHIKLPLIGLGQFIKTLYSEDDKEFARKCFYESLGKYLRKSKYNKIYIHLCIYDKRLINYRSFTEWDSTVG